MQACSILYKTRLPLLLVFNKVDVAKHDFAVTWMRARSCPSPQPPLRRSRRRTVASLTTRAFLADEMSPGSSNGSNLCDGTVLLPV